MLSPSCNFNAFLQFRHRTYMILLSGPTSASKPNKWCAVLTWVLEDCWLSIMVLEKRKKLDLCDYECACT